MPRGVDLEAYAAALIARFDNARLRHRLEKIVALRELPAIADPHQDALREAAAGLDPARAVLILPGSTDGFGPADRRGPCRP